MKTNSLKRATCIVAISLLMLACKKDTKVLTEKNATDTIVIQQDTVALIAQDSITIQQKSKLEKFGFPANVEGCSCYFAENKADFEAQKFVYVDDYGSNAYIKNGGKLIKIPMEEGDFDPANFSKEIENAEYKIRMKGQKISEMEETMMFRGIMNVENRKTGEKIETPIYGECGC